jgi:hypothetical protein
LNQRTVLQDVGNDEEKAQKLSMHPPRGRHDAGQEGTGDTIAVGVALALFMEKL